MTSPVKSEKPAKSSAKTVKEKDKSVVKSNRLNSADYNLELQEVRLVQLGIIQARETGRGFSLENPLHIHASLFAEVFDMTQASAYTALFQAADNLMDREIVFVDRMDGCKVRARWLQRCKYLDDRGAVEFVFTVDVEKEIMRIDGEKQFFTQYALSQTAGMKSIYSLRLYELMIQWRKRVYTPVFDLQIFRRQMSVPDSQYAQYSDFRKRVLEPAIKDIHKRTNMVIDYEPVKSGRVITGLRFKVVLSGEDLIDEEVGNLIRSVGGDVDGVEQGELSFDVEPQPRQVVLMNEKQAFKFARLLLKDSTFTAKLPQTLQNEAEALHFLKERFISDAQYIEKHLKFLQKHGYGRGAKMAASE